jgi:hypothetical protein
MSFPFPDWSYFRQPKRQDQTDPAGKAQALTGVTKKTALIREALRALIERESAKRLARLGGSEKQLKPLPRRQAEPA